ncbi:MAG TPA: hypothetical protein VLT79_11650 [Gemmatimonadales bacterium]|nr:hypothetical protein [Gemmatimonadales bacterium]
MRTLLTLCALLCVNSRLSGQATLPDAARQAAAAWSAHDPEALVGGSSRVALEIPGANPSGPVPPAQAIELLRRYLRPAREQGASIRTVKEDAPGSGFVVLERAYSLAGTTDVRRETLYLRYRKVAADWQLTELRAAP